MSPANQKYHTSFTHLFVVGFGNVSFVPAVLRGRTNLWLNGARMLHEVLPENIVYFVIRRWIRRPLGYLVGHHGHEGRLDVGLALARDLQSPQTIDTNINYQDDWIVETEGLVRIGARFLSRVQVTCRVDTLHHKQRVLAKSILIS